MRKPFFWRRLLLHVAFALVVSVVTKWVWDTVFAPYVWPPPPNRTWRGVALSIFGAIDFGFMNYTLIAAAHHAVAYLNRWRNSEVQSERLAKSLAEARLQSLQMQLEPHFLFNSLQSISQLVHEDPDAADRMLALLGDMLRTTLQRRGDQEIPLQEELRFLHQYVDVQDVRFRNRLQVRWSVDPAVVDAAIPPMLLQPLIENAFRHGLNGFRSQDILEIRCARENGRLNIEIADNGPGAPPASDDSQPAGIGLKNVAERLECYYGADQSFQYGNAKTGGFRVVLQIPFRLHENLSSIDS